ncbi:MAG TPA: hypothetical protein VLU47_15850 [Blastocatellia bacterium]|nr:hypothetical protein [Blastocatellia bacterium]
MTKRRVCSTFAAWESRKPGELRRQVDPPSLAVATNTCALESIGFRRRCLTAGAILAILLSAAAPRAGGQSAQSAPVQPESLSAAEFSRLSRDLSEEGGFFRSDNFTSNETAYLTVIEKLRNLGATGGAYIGVGPEQNFTYIAKLRPRIAFIVDIRRQAIIQHLMYKAIFHLAPNRIQFLSLLFSKPLTKDAPSPNATINDTLAYLGKISADDLTYAANLRAIRKAIQEDFHFPLSESDLLSLEYVYKNFRTEGPDIAFRIEGSFSGYFPSLQDLILQPDQHGKLGNFLASVEDYEFVRGMHRKNLIIPVVGNFGGTKALSAVGDYLRRNGFTVMAFYTSNVEQYLFDDNLFGAFANNVRRLPINEKSLLIRSVSQRYSHPAVLVGHRSTTFLQQMTVFLKDFDAGRYRSYRELITTNYIAPDKS